MDATTRLRRQFRKRADDPMACLIYRGGLYHYSRRVPAAVREMDTSLPEAIRRSTGTERLKEAQAIVREWATEDERRWLALLEGKGPSSWIASLSIDRDHTLDRASEVIEARAQRLGLLDELERARTPHEIPEPLRNDPATKGAMQAVYAARGKHLSWMEAWEAVETRSGLSVESRKTYASAVRQFDKANLPGPHDVTRDSVRKYLRERALRVRPKSINIDVAAASLILADLFDDNPERVGIFKGHALRYANKARQREPLTRDDINALIATGKLKPVVGLLMRLSLGTGARRQEAYGGTYHLQRRVLIVTPDVAKTASSVREIPLADRLIPVAQEWLKLREAKKIPRASALADGFAATRALAKIPASKTLHSCRHAFLTELARMGVPEDRRKALAGHSGRGDVHAGYVHLGPEDLREDVAKVDFETGLEWP